MLALLPASTLKLVGEWDSPWGEVLRYGEDGDPLLLISSDAARTLWEEIQK